MNVDLLDSVQPCGANPRQGSGQRRNCGPARTDRGNIAWLRGNQRTDLPDEDPIVRKIDVMDAVPQTPLNERGRQRLERSRCAYCNGCPGQRCIDGRRNRQVQHLPAWSDHVAHGITAQVLDEEFSEMPCSSDNQNFVAGQTGPTVAWRAKLSSHLTAMRPSTVGDRTRRALM